MFSHGRRYDLPGCRTDPRVIRPPFAVPIGIAKLRLYHEILTMNLRSFDLREELGPTGYRRWL